MNKSIIALTVLTAFSGMVSAAQHQHAGHHAHHEDEHLCELEHFTPDQLRNMDGKPATLPTIKANKQVAKTLNYADTQAFEDTNRGLIAVLDSASGKIIRDKFTDFIDVTPEAAVDYPDSVNPSLWRQAVANQAANGLYEVIPGEVYQVRGVDLASATFIRGETGWIVYDVLTTKESMAAALNFFLSEVPEGGDLKVVAMLYSHSHGDHFGGSRAVYEHNPDVKVYGSRNITKEIVDENVLAGNAMSRRVTYQYGNSLGRHAHGIVDAALAKGVANGELSYVLPHKEMNWDNEYEVHTIDGVEMHFVDASGTEAASEMVTYIPKHKALWTGELTYQGMHNIYTLRGAKVRDSLKWSKKINEMLMLWGHEAEYLFGSHSAPIWENDNIQEYLKMQRDAYGFTHNQTLRLANNGMVMQDIGDAIYTVMPESIQQSWHTNGYHGSYSHNARAVYNMYLGYFDMNPSNLNPLPVAAEAQKFVEYMGGCEAVTEKAKADFIKGEYRFVATAMDKVVNVCPDNQQARSLLADTYEQLGYQAESAGWRNVYLTGAQETRVGIQPGSIKAASADVLANMGIDNLLDYIAVKVDSTVAQHTPFTMNIEVTDTKAFYVTEMANGNFNNFEWSKYADELANTPKPKADATLRIEHGDVAKILMGQVTLEQLLKAGKASIVGDASVLAKLQAAQVEFDDKFEIVPQPAKGQEVDAELYLK
ncbi:MBL fold metallo-hydrolase [Shewanella maritima]|uniref:MBL fold metallo-hydrolase n=1 Tax=Shewanella maritima TaxID=2520507 RepID=A0A411PK98_9GAMM|nr:alkyl sulfatase dimerization domain-containing protein [Shewanella maritima]QBF83840.1 MBL fold metallo-hydrolase [Shewanella maritima]